MKKLTVLAFFFVFVNDVYSAVYLSKNVFKKVSFSSQYSNAGALIRNIDFESVNALIPQLEKKYNVTLEDRDEAHITTITPPEAMGSKKQKGLRHWLPTNEMLDMYKGSIQSTDFEIVCVGMRERGDKKVFFLVVDTPDLFDVRREIQNEVELRAQGNKDHPSFDSEKFWPHITIGFVNDDVHGVTKGRETCVEDVIIE